MKEKQRKKRIVSLSMALLIILLSTILVKPAETSAATKYIKVSDFIKLIVKERNWTIDPDSDQPYIDAAMEKGILKKGDFKNYSFYLTRTDCAILANRLDEFINFKYNYNQEVYNILKDCNYYEGNLYYNCKAPLYPEGATKDTYPASQFLEEVLSPALETTFKYDNWAEKGLRAGYHYIYDSEGKVLDRYMKIGVVPDNDYNFVGVDPFDDDSFIIRAWNRINEGERKIAAVSKNGISDLNKIAKNKRQAVIEIVAKGIIKGYSNGLYMKSRAFKGSNKISEKDAKFVIQRVVNQDKRLPISPDGQLIRTTKLPKNAGDYAYILDCFPNEYYEMKYNFMYYPDFYKGTVDQELFAYPKDTNYEFLYNDYYKKYTKVDTDKYKYYDETLQRVEQYLDCIFNVDYKTVDSKWAKKLASSFARHDDRVLTKWIDEYISSIKKNHVKLESQIISIDPNTLYYSDYSLHVRAYVKYRITADTLNVDHSNLIFGKYNSLLGLKNGEWREGYYDIRIISNNNILGISMNTQISDWVFKDSK